MDRLQRFLDAQARDYQQALGELRAGRKHSHWIWYVFPQLRELGRSPMSREFGIGGPQEAAAYLAHPVLGPRLVECVEAVLRHADRRAVDILGDIDALKFRSCLTLFESVANHQACFSRALQRFYPEGPDPLTLKLLNAHGAGSD